MSKKSGKNYWFWPMSIIFLLVLFLTSCSSETNLSPEEIQAWNDTLVENTKCFQTFRVKVLGLDRVLVHSYISENVLESKVVAEEKNTFALYASNAEQWVSFYKQLNQRISVANQKIAQLYPQNTAFPLSEIEEVKFSVENPVSVWRYHRSLDEPVATDVSQVLEGLECGTEVEPTEQTIYIDSSQILEYSNRSGYGTYSENVAGSEYIHVSLTSSNSSSLRYSYPKSWINRFVIEAFTNPNADSFEPIFVSIPGNNLFTDAHKDLVLAAISKNAEVISLQLNPNDYSGRKEIRAALKTALSIAAVERALPTAFVLSGVTISDENIIASLSIVNGQPQFVGWRLLTGQLPLSEYVGSFESLLSASVYVLE